MSLQFKGYFCSADIHGASRQAIVTFGIFLLSTEKYVSPQLALSGLHSKSNIVFISCPITKEKIIQ